MTGSRGVRGLLATPTRKVIAGVSAGFLGVVGAYAGTQLIHGAEKTFAGPPLTVRHVEGSGHIFAPYYVLPATVASGPSKLTPEQQKAMRSAGPWAQQHGVAGSPQIVRLELRGKTDEPVVITGIKITIASKGQPVKGWYVANPGCGAEPVRIASANLDFEPVRVTYSDEHGEPLHGTVLTTTRTDVELVELEASTSKGTVDWTAEILYTGPDGSGSFTVDDHGKPYRVTTEAASDGYRPEDGSDGLAREHDWDEHGITAC